MTNPVQVTQADRDAAARMIVSQSRNVEIERIAYEIRHGKRDHDHRVQAFARHRQTCPVGDDQQTRLYEAALQRLADQSRMIAERDDRIAELEAAVTRLTLALEMERGRGQPRAAIRTCALEGGCLGDFCPACRVDIAPHTEAAEHDRSFPDLGPSAGEVGRQDVLREIVEIAALYYDAADTMLDGPDESDEDMARGCIREAHKRLLAIKPAMDAALTPARTYQEGVEDAAKLIADWTEDLSDELIDAIRALGTKP